MTSVFNVAQYITKQLGGTVDTKRLQKLCYYSQAWSLTWGRGPLFPEKIEAWSGGPIIPVLFYQHQGQYWVSDVGGDSKVVERLPAAKDTIERVLATYGGKSGDSLGDMTHLEDPWVNARQGLSPSERSNREITAQDMIAYYGGVLHSRLSRA
jgi:uncharacterized phage-associated protein